MWVAGVCLRIEGFEARRWGLALSTNCKRWGSEFDDRKYGQNGFVESESCKEIVVLSSSREEFVGDGSQEGPPN